MQGPGDLKELTKDDFYSFLSSAPGLVVVDFYTDWWVFSLTPSLASQGWGSFLPVFAASPDTPPGPSCSARLSLRP